MKDNEKKQVPVCSRLCECLVERILSTEEKKAEGTSKAAIVSAVKGLHTFCKARPQLLVPHVTTLASYLHIADRSKQEESEIALHVAKVSVYI